MPPPKPHRVLVLLRALAFSLALSLAATYTVETLYPWYKKRRNLNAKRRVLKRLGHRLQAANLSMHESIVASQVVDSEEIEEGFDEIGGHDSLIKEICAVTTLPLQNPDMFKQSSLFTPARGVLLHGPPGTGKTMLARAVAKESGLAFINLDFGQVLSKYVGESEKLISAVFSLAGKLAPSMIFIDEIDCYMRKRTASDHEFTAQMKAQFMSCWDGFDKRSNVIVIAASNRPDSIDAAIMRRLPVKFQVDLPNLEQRTEILTKILKGENVSNDINCRVMSEQTEGYSGDDLRQLCKMAAMSTVTHTSAGTTFREMSMKDLMAAQRRVSPASAPVDVDLYGC